MGDNKIYSTLIFFFLLGEKKRLEWNTEAEIIKSLKAGLMWWTAGSINTLQCGSPRLLLPPGMVCIWGTPRGFCTLTVFMWP